MGHRANLVLVTGEGYDLYYSHWAANTLPGDLFWGPSHAARFIEAQRPDSAWLDEVWAEGGAVLDPGRRTLLLHGGEDVRYDVPRRRVQLELMRERWIGWEVRWAHEGIVDLIEAVGGSREDVLVESASEPPALAPFDDPTWISAVVSLREEGGTLRLVPAQAGHLDEDVARPDFLDAALAAPGVGNLDLGEFPSCGAHVDVPARRVELWTGAEAPDVVRRATRALPAGWTFHWHRDRYEAQLEATAGALALPTVDDAALVEACRRSLLGDRKPVDVAAIASRLRGEGKSVEVNPLALRDDRPAFDLAALASLFDEAVAARAARRAGR